MIRMVLVPIVKTAKRQNSKTSKQQGSYRKSSEAISPFAQRFNLDTEHHREGTERHGATIFSAHLCEKLRDTLCNYSMSIIHNQLHLISDKGQTTKTPPRRDDRIEGAIHPCEGWGWFHLSRWALVCAEDRVITTYRNLRKVWLDLPLRRLGLASLVEVNFGVCGGSCHHDLPQPSQGFVRGYFFLSRFQSGAFSSKMPRSSKI